MRERSRGRHVFLFLVSMLLALAGLSPSTIARADGPRPADIPMAPLGIAIPAPPAGFTHEPQANATWDYEPSASAEAHALQATFRADWDRIRRELGVDDSVPGGDAPVTIRVARGPDEMRRLAPAEAPPPEYAVGVAYPALSLVIVSLTAPETWQRPDVTRVFRHELSHLALHRAVGGNTVPLWFTEGLAIHQAAEHGPERMQTLWDATLRDRVIPIDDLDRQFPTHAGQVSLAYAESADFVSWLFRRTSPEYLPAMLARIRGGQDFEIAMSQTWSRGLGALELEWRDGLSERYAGWPLLLGGSLVWAFIGVLVLFAWRRRKQHAKEVLARWEVEEREKEAERIAVARRAALQELERRRLTRELGVLRAEADDAATESGETAVEEEDAGRREEPFFQFDRQRTEEVPTVTHDGKTHTLH